MTGIEFRWPRCGFVFAADKAAIKAGAWRRCTEPMLHYWLGGSRVHQGPLLADLERRRGTAQETD